MVYKVITKEVIDFDNVPIANIDTFKWEQGYEPKSHAQLIYVKNKGFALRLTSQESNPKAVYTEFGQPVYEDSCLEFFVRFDPQNPLYMNFETNSNGAFLASVRTDRASKRSIDELVELPVVKSSRQDTYWTIDTFFSLEFVNTLFGISSFEEGDIFYGNFYKCGDKTAKPHYGMWSPIDSDKPDFHRPEFFGTFQIA